MNIFDKQYLFPFAIIAFTTLIIEFAIRRLFIRAFYARKVLHIISICICAYVIQHSSNLKELSFIFLLFGCILVVMVRKKIFASSQNQSYGIAFFPFSFFVLLQMPFLSIQHIVFGVLTLGISDAIAGVVGYKYGHYKITFLTENKSLLGFITFYICTFLVLRFMNITDWRIIIIAFLPTLGELFSHRGSDNFTIPIVSSIWFYCIQNTVDNKLIQDIFVLIGIFGLARIAWYKKWLTFNGATAAIFIGTIVVFIADVLYLLPLAIFLISGSIASKLLNDKKEKTGRNAKQVFANGIVAIICLVAHNITQNQIYLITYFASIAISISDTLSSDIGRKFKRKTYNIINCKQMDVGLSGGISLIGTVAGLVAAIVFGILMYFIFSITALQAIIIISTGFFGMLIDSVLGSLLQAKYINNNGVIVEEQSNKLASGFAWCNNDVVNVMSNILTIILFVVIASL